MRSYLIGLMAGIVIVVGELVLLTGMLPVGWSVGGSSAEAAPPNKGTCASSTGASWDQNQTGSCRFTVLADFGGAAVRDNNTGLVWEQAPDPNARAWFGSDSSATWYCVNKTVGSTVGWRLPSVVELKSLQDLSLPPPFVPENVFTGVQSAYWTATTSVVEPVAAWFVRFLDGLVSTSNKTNQIPAWCVRGGMNADAY